MRTSTKLIATGAASVLGLALAVGGAQAASGSLTAHDAPGHVVQVSGVVPVSAHTSPTATAPANPNTKGLSGATVAHPATRATTHATTLATTHATVRQVARPAPQPLPAHHESRSDCGPDYGHTDMTESGSHMR